MSQTQIDLDRATLAADTAYAKATALWHTADAIDRRCIVACMRAERVAGEAIERADTLAAYADSLDPEGWAATIARA